MNLLLIGGDPIGELAKKAVPSSKLSAASVNWLSPFLLPQSRVETNVVRSLRDRMARDIGPGWRSGGSDNFGRQLPSQSSAVISAVAFKVPPVL